MCLFRTDVWPGFRLTFCGSHWIADAVLATHSVEDGRDPDDDIIEDFSRFVSRSGERNPSVIVEPADGRIPYQPWAAAKRHELLVGIFTPTKWEHVDPHVRAFLDGVPRNNYTPGGMQISQRPGAVMILYESNHGYRLVPTDGRPHLGENVKLFMPETSSAS